MNKKKNISEVNNFKTIDMITKVFAIFVSIVLGTIFLCACIYMLKMIDEAQNESKDYKESAVQNINLVNM